MPKGQTDSKPIVRSMAEVADAFGVKGRAISDWVNRGMPRTQMSGQNKFWYDLDEIYDWRVAYLDSLAVAKTTINPEIQAAIPHMGELGAKVEEFKLKKADILATEQMSSLDIQSRIKKLKLGDLDDEALMKLTNAEAARWFQLLGVDFAIKFDKENIERGKSVDNVSKILGIITQLKEIDGQGTSDG